MEDNVFGNEEVCDLFWSREPMFSQLGGSLLKPINYTDWQAQQEEARINFGVI